MPVRNQNWYDLQEGRRYPLDDLSTGRDDASEPIADNILVDCHIRFPESLGTRAYVSAITVSANLVSVIISAAADENSPAGFTPIAAISLSKPLQIGTNHAVQPLVAGVAGWVAFGSGVGENFQGRYSAPIQTVISPRCARPYRDLPIPTLGKINLATALSGVVKILGRTPVTATYEIVDVENEQVPAIVFRLTGDLVAYNPLKEFGGPCKGRPESGTCAKPGLQNINGVQPDCLGNIEISTDGFTIIPFEGIGGACGGGFDLITDRGLSAACQDGGGVPRKPRDLCVPEIAGSEADPTEYWPDPLDQVPLPPDVVSSINLDDPANFGSCYPENTCFDFSDGIASAFVTKTGLFVFDTSNPPADIICNEDGATDEEADYENRYVYAAADVSGINVAVLRNCSDTVSSGGTVSTVFKLSPGPGRNGGLIINYNPADPFFKTPTRFIAVTLDIDAGGLRVIRYSGSNLVTEARALFTSNTEDWYALSVTTQHQTNGTIISAVVINLTTNATTNLVANVSQFGAVTNTVGLFSNKAYTYFSRFVFGA